MIEVQPEITHRSSIVKLQEFVRYFIPESLLKDEVERFRAITIVGYSLVNVLTVFVCVPILLVLRMDMLRNLVGFGVLALIALTSYWTLSALRKTESTIIAGNVNMLMMFIIIFTSVYITGGLGPSPINIFLTIVPVFAFLLCGFFSGLFWASLVVFLQSFGVYAETNAANPPIQVLTDAVYAQFAILGPVFMLMFAAFASTAFELINRELNTRLAREKNRFSYKASHDALTGLANRQELNTCLAIAVKTSQLNKSRLSTLVYMDLDGFKQVNDTLGHKAGDEVLKVVAQRLLSVTRSSDFVARFGGDEFALLLTGAACREDLIPLLNKIISTVAEPIIIDGREVQVRTSLGVSVCPEDTDDEFQMTRQADMALYEAKKTKNTFCFYRDIRRNVESIS